jgi:hypothetical protein
MTEMQRDLDASLKARFAALPDQARVDRTVWPLEANGITVVRAATGEDAKQVVLDLIPPGSEVHHGASQTLEAIGITEEIEHSGRYEPLRARIFSMDRETQYNEIRRLAAAPDVMLGSVAAVTETGTLVAASASGGQLGPYASGGREGDPRRRDAQDRVQPRRSDAARRSVRASARERARASRVRREQQREQGTDHQSRVGARTHRRSPRRRGARVLTIGADALQDFSRLLG